MVRGVIWICIAILALSALTYSFVIGANIPVLQPMGPVAAGELWVIVVTVLLCSLVVVPVFVMLFYFAWRYRATNPKTKKHHSPEWDHLDGSSEFIWWLAPTAIVIALSFVAWQTTHDLDPYKPLKGGAPLVVEVVALNWKWLFMYPSLDIATVNTLVFPVNTPITFHITADAPMNSFWIPALGGQIMAMPGMSTQLNLLASKTGTFNGLSGNLSGNGFAGMHFGVRSVSQSDFDAWVAEVKQTSNPLSVETYTALADESLNNPPAYYAGIEQNLYTTIINKFMIPVSTSTMPEMDMSNMHM